MGTKDLTSKKLITVSVDDKVIDAARIMRENRIRHLPVTDGNAGVVGIISSKDLPIFVEAKDMSVEFFMSTPVIHVDQDLPLKEAVYRMLENKISCLVVSDENKDGILPINFP